MTMSNQATQMQEMFGETIHAYTRKQAIEDGCLVDVSRQANGIGFRVPVAMTRAAWVDCVEWVNRSGRRRACQNESDRLLDVLMTARHAAMESSDEAQSLRFTVYRVPPGGVCMSRRFARLVLHIGGGDMGEPVITITQPGED
jgi:hypothetical protein